MVSRRHLVAGAIGTFVLMAASTLPYPILEPFVLERFELSTLATSLYVTVNLGAYVLTAPVWGALVDGWGRPRWLIAAGLTGQALGLAVQPLVGDYTVLLGVRFLEGASTMLAMTALHATVLARARREATGAAVGAVGVGMALGVATGSALGGILGQRSLSLPFQVAPVALVATAVLLVALLRAHEPVRRRASLADSVRVLRRRPTLWVPVAFSFLDRLTVGFLVGILPLFLGQERGLDPALIGGLMSAFLVTFGLFQYPFGRLSDRTGRYPFLVAGSALYGAVLILIPLAPLPWLWLVMVAGGVVGAFMWAPTFALVGDATTEDEKGAGVALFHQAGSLGFAAGPLLGATIVEAGGSTEAFLTMGVGEALAALAVAVVLWRVGLIGSRGGTQTKRV